MTALDVYFHSDRVGRLERLAQARLRFAYEPTWVTGGGPPLSLNLPVGEESFEDEACRPFFAGLLPEGEFLKAVARAFHVSAGNPFSVLAEIGGECAGAVSLVAPGQAPAFAAEASPRWLDEAALATLLEELPSRPLMIDDEDDEGGVRLSLAGTRDKLGVLVGELGLGITRGQPPTSHILKQPIPDVEGMVANEAFCMALAREAGLSAATATPIRAGGREALLVERYDRARDEDNVVHRVHQEDFCQALGFLPEQKYESDGGPGVAACASLLRAHSAVPAADLLAFLDALVFNLLIGNADAHSKNYSLILEGERSPRLAPLYDLLSTRVYGHRLGRKMGMKYGGEYRPDWIRGRHLDRLAGALGISAPVARKRGAELARRVADATEAARAGLPDPWRAAAVIDGIEAVVREQSERLATAAAEPA
jgi:serine/threonine-protein kinase HipA